jgi:hypothetical protein
MIWADGEFWNYYTAWLVEHDALPRGGIAIQLEAIAMALNATARQIGETFLPTFLKVQAQLVATQAELTAALARSIGKLR